jgi:BNR/Asp-box repeat
MRGVCPAAFATAFCLLVARAGAGEWEATTAELIKAEKPGYGGLCGVAVDHTTGAVHIDLSDKGLYRSTDQGKTWKKHGPAVKDRTEWPGCLLLDPTEKTKRIVMAVVYGAPIGVSPDNGESWSQLDSKSTHVDWAIVDWTDSEMKYVMALKHESGGLLLSSHDGGKTFREVGKGYGPGWIFDDRTAVVAEARTKDRPKPRLLRTADAGKSFEPVGEYTATALPKWRDGTLYWLVHGFMIATTDRGATWKKLSDVKDGLYGPIFGRNAQHLLVLTKTGILESMDGGENWNKPIVLPKELKGTSPLTWLDYDPKNDVVYVMKMGSDLYRLTRSK